MEPQPKHRQPTPRPAPVEPTIRDLLFIEECLRDAEHLRFQAASALARVQSRGDGEQHLGMPVEAKLRSHTRIGRDATRDLSVLADVLDDMPTLRGALAIPLITVTQGAAVARHAARHGLTIRRALDTELREDVSWTRWEPEHLGRQIGRLVATLLPHVAVEAEKAAPAREFLHVQPTLDGQAVVFNGRLEGANAAIFNAAIHAATPAPTSGVRRGVQAAAGLSQILAQWCAGSLGTPGGDTADDGRAEVRPPVTIHLLIDEATATEGAAAELWTTLPGLAPRLTAAGVHALTADNTSVTTITTLTRDGNPVAIAGRAGHAIDDPDGLSWDSLTELVRVRDGSICRMPGCDRPVTDIHHLIHRVNGGPDRLDNLAGVCVRCHHRVLHRHRWTGHIHLDGRLNLRRGPHTTTTPARKHLRLKRPPPLADPEAAAREPGGHPHNPLPF